MAVGMDVELLDCFTFSVARIALNDNKQKSEYDFTGYLNELYDNVLKINHCASRTSINTDNYNRSHEIVNQNRFREMACTLHYDAEIIRHDSKNNKTIVLWKDHS